jgi:hypothetical protein
MNNLHNLKHFAEKTNNISAVIIINKYIKNALKNNVYYLGGQLDMKLDDDINEKNIDYVLKKYSSTGPCNSWKINEHSTNYHDILIIKELIISKIQMTKLNGIFKSICIWIIPAAKRAKSKYKQKSKTFFNTQELMFHKRIIH